MELGGFAETPEVIDATQEEFEAFNYCLACDYLAAIENNNFNLATIFLYNGNYDVRLFLTVITETPITEFRDFSILDIIFRNPAADLSNCITFFNSLFSMLEEKYVLLESPEDKAEFLRKIKPYIASIRIPSEFKKDIRMTQIAKMNKYSWQKALRM